MKVAPGLYTLSEKKMCMWPGKLLARSGQIVYDIVLREILEKPIDNEEDNTQ